MPFKTYPNINNIAAKDKTIAIIPDFNNSALTFGPTFSTLLKLNPEPIDFVKFSLISPN